MKRRNFVKSGSLVISGLSMGKLSLAFVPDNFYESREEFKNSLPFRKQARKIREVVSGFLWADAADFDNYGGWALDTQFAGFMGSSYLLAHGSGTPVKNATLQLKDVKPGRYRLWIRDKNWIPEYAPGRFGISLNGKELNTSFGTRAQAGWSWEDGGIHDISEPNVSLSLLDKTGYYGRCSSVLLTRDLDYRPPIDLKEFKQERARLSGISNKPVKEYDYDVVIVGGGTAGCCAAIAAARQGARTALITDRPVVGGNASAEIGVPTQGATAHHPTEFMRESGIIEEAGRLGKAKGWGSGGHVMTRPFRKLMDDEPLLDHYTDLRLEEAVDKVGGSIRRIVMRHTLTGENYGFSGKFFIDTTGDGWLGYYSGADYRHGREARGEFNESLAPAVADSLTMSGCLRGPRPGFNNCLFYKTTKSRAPVKYVAPEWIHRLPPWEEWRSDDGPAERYREARLPHEFVHGTWWIEHSNDVDDLWDPEFARDELLRINYTFWDFVKNKWPERELAANYRLDYVPYTNGKRETRRLMGDHVLSENELHEMEYFEDAIGHTGWTLDLHALKGIFDTNGMYYCDVRVPVNQIPYRSLYSRNVDNLFMAGRNGSYTHVALGTVRVQGQTCVTGQAAGTAAAIALKHKTSPRGVYEQHRKELQQVLLKEDQFIPLVYNEDPTDLARNATVSASSFEEAPRVSFGLEESFSGKNGLISTEINRGIFFPWMPGQAMDSISLRLKVDKRSSVILHLRSATYDDDLTSTKDLATVTQTLEPGEESWISFPVNKSFRANFLWLHLEGDASVHWRIVKRPTFNTYRIFGAPGKWRQIKDEVMAFYTNPEIAYANEDAYLPSNIINGIARPTRLAPNYWLSSARKKLPQWIELELPETAEVSIIQCVFDTDLVKSLPSQDGAFPEVCVRSYRIECEVNGAWVEVAREDLNFQRFRRHQFKPQKTQRIRLTVEAMHGVPQARVVEIRAYKEYSPLYTA